MNFVCIINKKNLKKNPLLKEVKKINKSYLKSDHIKSTKFHTRAKIQKFANLTDISLLEAVDEKCASLPLKSMSADGIITLCRDAGITGGSGNGFPVSDKLDAIKDKNVTLIINGVECDPGLVHDAWIYRNRFKEVVCGINLLRSAFGFRRVILATKEPLNMDTDIEQVKIADRFPMGYENALIKAVLDIDLAPGEKPTDRNILVMNIQTVLSIANVISDKASAKEKYITLALLDKAKAYAVKVKVGMKLSDIITKLVPSEELESKLIYAGGGALFCHKADSNEIVEPTTSYIAIANETIYDENAMCKKCGKCTGKCPAGVSVHKIVGLSAANSLTPQLAKALGADKCIGCGACTYGCAAGKDIRQIVFAAKELI